MRSRILPVARLSAGQKKAMASLMERYYEGQTEKKFLEDLAEKQKVILLLGEDGAIRGFSTLLERQIRFEGKTFIALFSGDTVLEQKYWGNGALGKAFGRYLIQVKWRYPHREVYWFLISKGYKTYLLMTNNFASHYPRFERPTPDRMQRLMDSYYQGRYGSDYDPVRGIVRPQAGGNPLKKEVADITEELMRDPRIAFFQQRNPGWKLGEELACVARVSLWTPFRYVIKRGLKVFSPGTRRLK